MTALADAVILSVQEDDFEPYTTTLAEMLALCPSDYPEAARDNTRIAALAVGESYVIDEGPLACAPVWTITRLR